MSWLGEQFGWELLNRVPVVLPSVEFFPDPFNGTEEDVQRLLERICGYMQVDSARVHLGFYSEEGPDLGEDFRLDIRQPFKQGLRYVAKRGAVEFGTPEHR